jgi:uncharacterized protein (TIGR03000 family)
MQARLFVFFLSALASLVLLPLPAAKSQDNGKKQVTFSVLVPDINALLSIDGVPTRQLGTKRSYVSPPLDVSANANYKYTFRAVWEPNNYTRITRTRELDFDPGRGANFTVDLTKADPRWKDDIVVRFVPTPNKVVDAMCALAKVNTDDVVYDLGCGDGRMVIRAVEKFGARKGVGIDLDPELVKQCRANAKKAKVETKVTFREGDVLKIDDIPDASVVLLYMGDDINLRLRPILQAKLKPGARVVSHRFTMGDWVPKTTQTINVDGEDFLIHLWVIGESKQ